MKKLILTTTAALAFGAVAATAEEVRVYNWSDYIDEALLEKFEAETGIDLIYDVFDSNEVLETKMLAGGSGYDVVVPSGTFLQRQITAGAFQKLDKSKLPNKENMWDAIEERTAQYDPDNAYSINYMWGTTGLGVNVGKVTKRRWVKMRRSTAWTLILDPANMEKLAGMRRLLPGCPDRDRPDDAAISGRRPGQQGQGCDRQGGSRSAAHARRIVKKFHSSEYINALANGDICVAIGWSGDVLQARDRAAEADNGVEIAYNAFAEGVADVV